MSEWEFKAMQHNDGISVELFLGGEPIGTTSISVSVAELDRMIRASLRAEHLVRVSVEGGES